MRYTTVIISNPLIKFSAPSLSDKVSRISCSYINFNAASQKRQTNFLHNHWCLQQISII